MIADDYKMNCPVCTSPDTHVFLAKTNQPVHQQLINKTAEESRNIFRDKIDLALCDECGFIFNQSFDSEKMLYGDDYENNDDSSPVFQDYLDSLIDRLITKHKIVDGTIVEIGCGKGKFLKSLCEKGNNIGYGFDPSYKGPLEDLDGKLKFYREYYDSRFSNIVADVILSRHVIEHVPDPANMIKMVKETLKNSPNAKIFFETPTVLWTLKNYAVWDFGYEHCSYFTPDSLSTLFELSGFQVDNVFTTFDGLYIWLEASLNDDVVVHKNPQEASFLVKDFVKHEDTNWNKWKEIISELSSNGKVALWGAGRKCVVFANTLDPDAKYFEGIIDIDPKKQGTFLTGTGHETFDYTEIKKRGITSVILMNPYYTNEIKQILFDNDINVKTINA